MRLLFASALLLPGCAAAETVGSFFGGMFTGAAKAMPEVLPDAAGGNWIGSIIGLTTAAIIGGVLEVKRRKRKKNNATPPA